MDLLNRPLRTALRVLCLIGLTGMAAVAQAGTFTGNNLTIDIGSNGALGPISYNSGDGVAVNYVLAGGYAFSVGVNGSSAATQFGDPANPFNFTLTDTGSGNTLSALLQGNFSGLDISRTVTFDTNSSFLAITTTFTNTTSATLNNIAFLDSLNPDPGVDQGLSNPFGTTNDVVSALGLNNLVTAGDIGGARSIGLGTVGAGAFASVLGAFPGLNPYDYLSTVDPDGAIDDLSLNLAYGLGALDAGQSVSRTTFVAFGTTPGAVQSTFAAATVPEPASTLGLLVLGASGWAARRKKKN
ncbi:PEP-CTERM sorting domain-containing protein [Anthocerotibacter panamensis]|uniref:PEP-CTERM sorting domain-containing protein n=1 Tax=Anthocerotibacter panamensis TaxID=2857077 RepID=UPI001C4068BA|nr:PEP-CTERM sorting domain-containing protein [Anthocerotibacter panamensis]